MHTNLVSYKKQRQPPIKLLVFFVGFLLGIVVTLYSLYSLGIADPDYSEPLEGDATFYHA